MPRTTLKTPSLFFCESLFFEDISTPRSEWQTVLITTLVLQDWPQRYILSFFYKFSGALSLSRMVVEFSLKHLCFTKRVKNFQIYRFHIPRKSEEFLRMPSRIKTLPQVLVVTPYRQKEITDFPWLGTLLMTWNTTHDLEH